jgi:3',5'-cyclic AMP phosphodiesterase CpdA
VTRIAHLSDLHLNGTEERRVRFALALEKAARGGAEYLILTGDLTADGTDKQFEEVSASLAGWPVGRVTLIGGNHDLAHKDWKAAILSTSLGRFAKTSVPGGGHADLYDCTIYPVSTQYPRRALVFRALGQITDYDLAMLGVVAERERVRPIVVAMHHGPQWHPLQFFDGLTNRSEMISLLERAPNITILCGHDHRALDLHDGRIYTAASVADHDDPLRLYDVVGNRIVPVYRSADPGRYL